MGMLSGVSIYNRKSITTSLHIHDAILIVIVIVAVVIIDNDMLIVIGDQLIAVSFQSILVNEPIVVLAGCVT